MALGIGRFLQSLLGALDLVGDAIGRDFFYAPVDASAFEETAPILDDGRGARDVATQGQTQTQTRDSAEGSRARSRN
jgi:hypothetical protein